MNVRSKRGRRSHRENTRPADEEEIQKQSEAEERETEEAEYSYLSFSVDVSCYVESRAVSGSRRVFSPWKTARREVGITNSFIEAVLGRVTSMDGNRVGIAAICPLSLLRYATPRLSAPTPSANLPGIQ